MHEICFDEPGKGQWAFNNPVRIVSQTQQQKGDKGSGNLDTNGILRSPEEVADFQRLFHPSEEQLDGPSPFVQIGNFFCAHG